MPRLRRSNLGRKSRSARRIAKYRANLAILKRATFSYDVSIDNKVCECVATGLMQSICPHCKEMRYENEVAELPCVNDNVKLEPLDLPPEPLYSTNSKAYQCVATGLVKSACPHCKAMRYENEVAELPSANDNVKLEPLDLPPEPLYFTDSIPYQCVDTGLMKSACPHCKARIYENEVAELPSANDNVKLEPLDLPPEPLY